MHKQQATNTPQKAHQQTNTKKVKSTTYQRSAIHSVPTKSFPLCFLFLVLLSQSDAIWRLFIECVSFGAALSIIISRCLAHSLNILISSKILLFISLPFRGNIHIFYSSSPCIKTIHVGHTLCRNLSHQMLRNLEERLEEYPGHQCCLFRFHFHF